MKTSGQTNKRLCGLISLSGTPLQAEMRLTTDDGEPKEVGWITSAARSQTRDQQIALGYLKRGFYAPASRVRAIAPAQDLPVEVATLPFS